MKKKDYDKATQKLVDFTFIVKFIRNGLQSESCPTFERLKILDKLNHPTGN